MSYFITNYQKVKIKGSLHSEINNSTNSNERYRFFNLVLDLSEYESLPDHISTRVKKVVIVDPGMTSYNYNGGLLFNLYARTALNGTVPWSNWVSLVIARTSLFPSNSTGFIKNIGQANSDTLPVVEVTNNIKQLNNPLTDSWATTYEIPGATLEYDADIHGYGMRYMDGDELSIRVYFSNNLVDAKPFTRLPINEDASGSGNHGGDFQLNATIEIESEISGTAPPADPDVTFEATVSLFDFSHILDIYPQGNVKIDWGDGNYIEYTDTFIRNTPTGKVTIKNSVGSEVTGIEFRGSTVNGIDIMEGGTLTTLKDCCDGLTTMRSFSANNTSNVTDLSSAWKNCNSMNSFYISDTSGVTNFYYAWQLCTSLINFSLIDTSSATTLAGAWQGCSGLTSLPEFSTSSVTDFSSTFSGCENLIQMPDIDLGQGTDFTNAWNGCIYMTSFLPSDLSEALTVESAWYRCENIIPFPSMDISKATNLEGAWGECASITSFPQLGIGSATSLKGAWSGCLSLTSFPLLDTSSVTNFQSAWYNCSGLESFPELDISSALILRDTWNGCSTLKYFPPIDTSLATDMYDTFLNCDNLICLSSYNTLSMTIGDGGIPSSVVAPSLAEQEALKLGDDWTNSMPCPESTFEVRMVPTLLTQSQGVFCDEDFEIDWGDGIYVQYSGGNQAISVASGDYTVRNQPNKIITFFRTTYDSITEMHVTKAETLTSAYRICNQSNLIALSMSGSHNIEDWHQAFTSSWSLIEFPVIDMSGGKDFRNTWENCSGMVRFPNIDFPLGEDFSSAWKGCVSLEVFESTNFSSAWRLTSAWSNCYVLDNFPAITLGSLTTLNATWFACRGLTHFPAIDTTGVGDFTYTWNGCTALVCLTNVNTTAASSTQDMFNNTPALVMPDASSRTAILSGSDWNNSGACP